MAKRIWTNQRLAVVTGAGAGIGRAHARALAEAGAWVAVVDRPGNVGEVSSAQLVADELSQSGVKAFAIELDLKTVEAGRQAIELAQAHADLPVSIVINNAGIAGKTNYLDVDDSEVDQLFGTHVFAYLGSIQACLPVMHAQKYGRIINTVSEVAFGSRFGDGGVVYAAAKAAVWSMTLNVANQCHGTGVTVNALSPGAKTGMSASLLESQGSGGIDLDPSYVAQVGVWLASDSSEDVNGKVIHVAGPNVREYVGMKRINGTELVQRISTECGF